MTALPIIRQYPFAQITSTLDRMNVDVQRVLARHGIPDWRRLKAQDFIPLTDYLRAFEAAAQATGEEGFSIAVVEEHNLDKFPKFGDAILSGVTVYDAIMISCRLISEQARTLRFWVSHGRNGVLFCRQQQVAATALAPGLRQVERLTIALLLHIVRSGAGPSWTPPKAFVLAQKNKTFEQWEMFHGSEAFYNSPFTGIFVPNKVLTMPLPRRGLGLTEEQRSFDRPALAEGQGGQLIADIRDLTVSLCRERSANLGTLSDVTMLSPRTLQRMIRNEGQSFRQIVDQARFKIARELMEDDSATVADISETVGYEHPQHFIRAFRRWAGVTPQEFRRLAVRAN